MDYKVLSATQYDKMIRGYSITGSMVEIIGEQTVQLSDGRIVEQYVYNIVGVIPQNGKPFMALKANIYI